jgi:hypothetical protein
MPLVRVAGYTRAKVKPRWKNGAKIRREIAFCPDLSVNHGLTLFGFSLREFGCK